MQVVALIGDPIIHSLSPRLHNFWLHKYQIDALYVPLLVSPANLGQAVRLLPFMGICNFNVTSPHKETIIPYLDEIDQIAKKLGAVNIVYKNDQQKLVGSNSDCYGFNKAVGAHCIAKNVIVLGSGGAARAIIADLLDNQVKKITLISRNRHKAEQIISDYGSQLIIIGELASKTILAETDVLINTVPNLSINFDLTGLKSSALIIDSNYNPAETNLLHKARLMGNQTQNGLWMLIYQAAKAFELWFGVYPKIEQELYDYLNCGRN